MHAPSKDWSTEIERKWSRWEMNNNLLMSFLMMVNFWKESWWVGKGTVENNFLKQYISQFGNCIFRLWISNEDKEIFRFYRIKKTKQNKNYKQLIKLIELIKLIAMWLGIERRGCAHFYSNDINICWISKIKIIHRYFVFMYETR